MVPKKLTMMTSSPTALFCRHYQGGPRRVLALHCTIAFSGAWRGLAKQLPECSVMAPDMLSHGQSPDWDRQGDFAAQMDALLDPLLDEPMDVIGHSLGGVLALRLATRMPERVRSLTLVEPVFFALAGIDAPDLAAQEDADMRPVFEALEAGDEPGAARIFNRMWGDTGTRWDDMPEQTRNALVRGIHVVQAGRSAVQDDHGILSDARLSGLHMPVLLLRGGGSPPIVKAVNDGLARRLPNARSEAIPGAGHMLPITHAGDTVAHLRALFEQAPV